MDEIYIPKLLQIATKLRKKHKVILSYEARKLAKHLENGDKINSKHFLCMGKMKQKAKVCFIKI